MLSSTVQTIVPMRKAPLMENVIETVVFVGVTRVGKELTASHKSVQPPQIRLVLGKDCATQRMASVCVKAIGEA